jgi:Tol biopolymer transport system component
MKRRASKRAVKSAALIALLLGLGALVYWAASSYLPTLGRRYQGYPTESALTVERRFQSASLADLSRAREKIAYVVPERGTTTVVVTDGTNEVRLAEGEWPVWASPDKLAYLSSGDIILFDFKKARWDRLASGRVNAHADFSADGKKMAYASTRLRKFSANTDVYLLDLWLRTAQRLTSDEAFDDFPKFLGADRIVFVSSRDGDADLYVLEAGECSRKGRGRKLTFNQIADFGPHISPDGKYIVWAQQPYRLPQFPAPPPNGRRAFICKMDADGSNQVKLTDFYYSAVPEISPDGRKIAFVAFVNGNEEIYTMNMDGTEKKNLTRNPARDTYPSWSPDSKKIAFISDRPNYYQMFYSSAGKEMTKEALYIMELGGRVSLAGYPAKYACYCK